tara:strand:- start:751 stop:1377 length:627 start_codon:yes stop_codon:yes gene_type:complete
MKFGDKFSRNELAQYIIDLKGMMNSVKNPKILKLLKKDLKDVKAALAKKKMYHIEAVNLLEKACWTGYKQIGMKKKNGKSVPNCVPEVKEHCGCEHEESYDISSEELGEGYTISFCNCKETLGEAEYQGRKVKLNKPMQGDKKKFKVYVKNQKGNVVVVHFGQGGDAKGGTMRIRKSNPKARASFRARHNCDNPGPKWKARYWSCKKW